MEENPIYIHPKKDPSKADHLYDMRPMTIKRNDIEFCIQYGRETAKEAIENSLKR